ncbi:hypothetical protein [Streptomyces sp. NPDC005303]|uniref:hypothetical protein n=1 Tax=Streptomyces sp. NPDC005303 TaxID=3155713 RepID=UPI00339EE2D3
MTVRVGMIGAGVMGADHVRLLHGFVSSARVVAVADLDGAGRGRSRPAFRGRSSAPTRCR